MLLKMEKSNVRFGSKEGVGYLPAPPHEALQVAYTLTDDATM